MLTAMRDRKKLLAIVLWLVILAFVSTIFVVWGIGARDDVATYFIKIDGEDVSYAQYSNYYTSYTENLRQTLGDAYNDYASSINMEEVVINEFIDMRLLHNEAIRLGVPVGDVEIVSTISQNPAFHTNGVFDPNVYIEMLQFSGLTPATYEQALRDEILINKTIRLISNSQAVVSDEEVELEYNARNTEAKVSFINVPVSKFDNMVDTADEKVMAYYESNKENYRVPTKVRLKYITFDKAEFGKNIVISDEEIEEYYNTNAESYGTPARATIQTMDIAINNWNDNSEVEHAMNDFNSYLPQLDNTSSNFYDVAQKLHIKTEDTGKQRTVNISSLPQEVASVVALMEAGSVSGVIRTPVGFTVVKLVARSEGVKVALEEVREKVHADLFAERLDDEYRKHVLSTYQEILRASNITAYNAANADNALETLTTELFAANEVTFPALLDDANLVNYIFTLTPSEVSQLAEYDGKTYLFEVEERENSFIPQYEVVAAQVLNDYTKNELETIALQEVKKSIEDAGLDATAKKYNVKVEKSTPFKRAEPFGTFILNQDLVASIFKTKAGDTVMNSFIIGSEVIGVKVDELNKPDMAGLEDERSAISAAISQLKANAAILSYVSTLQAEAEVVVNPAFLTNPDTVIK